MRGVTRDEKKRIDKWDALLYVLTKIIRLSKRPNMLLECMHRERCRLIVGSPVIENIVFCIARAITLMIKRGDEFFFSGENLDAFLSGE